MSVVTSVETAAADPGTREATTLKLQIQLVGELRVVHDGHDRPLPRSRKTRGLLAYLALEARHVRRAEICQLLWDVPDDPRASLRWSLSKLRPALADDERTALQADRETVALDRSMVSVDVLDIHALMARARGEIGDEELSEIESRFTGSGLDGLDDAGTRRYQLWLESQRQSIRKLHLLVIDELQSRASLSPSERLRLAARRISLDPLSDRSNIKYLRLSMELSGLGESRRAFHRMRDHYRAENHPDAAVVAAWREMARPDAPAPAPVAAVPSREEASPAMPDRPSLAVLDFSDLGAHEEGAVLARGLAVDLNSRLAQLPSLFVIARQSATRVDAARLTPRQIGARLGVRYLISGSTQRQDRRVRATVTLIDAMDESELWSEHFDRPLDDLFSIQDDITDSVIAAVEPAIERAEMERALIKAPDSLSAWENFHRGLWHCFRFTVNDNEIAHALFRQALIQDPKFARAHAGISFTHYSRAFLDSGGDVDREIGAALEAGRTSIGFDGRDAMGHWSLGRALFLSRRHDEALLAIDQALSVNPNYAHGHYARGFVGIHAALDDMSLESLDTAQHLSPYDPLLFAMKSSRAISLASQGRYAEAASWAIRGTHEPNAHFHIYAVAAACLELAGRPADARNNARWALERRPDYSVDMFQRSFPHKEEASREHILAALVRAGIPRRCPNRGTRRERS